MMITILTNNFNDIYSEWNTRNSWKNGRERECTVWEKRFEEPRVVSEKEGRPVSKIEYHDN